MKMKGIAVIGLLVLSCSFAVAGNWTFGFGSVYGGLYCNWEFLDNDNTQGVAGVEGAAYEGGDVLTTCGYPLNSTIAGFGPYTLPKGVTFYGYKVTVSKGVAYADDIYDTEALAYTGYQWAVASSLACSTKTAKKNKDWWIGLASVENFVFGDNAGPVSCTIPAKGKHNGLLTTGQAAK